MSDVRSRSSFVILLVIGIPPVSTLLLCSVEGWGRVVLEARSDIFIVEMGGDGDGPTV